MAYSNMDCHQRIRDQFCATEASCSSIGGRQSCPVTAIEIGLGQQQNPTIQLRLCVFSWRRRLGTKMCI